MRIILMYSCLIFLFFSCSNEGENTKEVVDIPLIQPVDNNLPDVDFPENIYPLGDTSATIEIKMEGDSPLYFFNKKNVEEDSLLFALNDWRSDLPKESLSRFTPILKIEKQVPIHYVERLKMGLRFMRQLRIAFFNQKEELLLSKLPIYMPQKGVKPFALPAPPSLLPPPPPPPIAVWERRKKCYYENKKFGEKGKSFETLKECLEELKIAELSILLTKGNLSINQKSIEVEKLTSFLLELTSDFDERLHRDLIIFFDYDDSISFGEYLKAYSNTYLYFTNAWDKSAEETFSKTYNDLDESERRIIRSAITRMVTQTYLRE